MMEVFWDFSERKVLQGLGGRRLLGGWERFACDGMSAFLVSQHCVMASVGLAVGGQVYSQRVRMHLPNF